MKVTLCDKIINSDILTHSFDDKTHGLSLVNHWLENKDFNKNCFVCFQTWETDNVRDEQQEILVSHNLEQIELFCIDIVENIDLKDISLCIYEFKNYHDAFRYCSTLKEGF